MTAIQLWYEIADELKFSASKAIDSVNFQAKKILGNTLE